MEDAREQIAPEICEWCKREIRRGVKPDKTHCDGTCLYPIGWDPDYPDEEEESTD